MKKTISLLVVGILAVMLFPAAFAEIISPVAERNCDGKKCVVTLYSIPIWQKDSDEQWKDYTSVSRLTKKGSGGDWYLSLEWNGQEIKLDPYFIINGKKHDKVPPNANFDLTTEIQDKKAKWKFGHRLIKNQNIDAFGYDIITNLSCSLSPPHTIVCGGQKISFDDIILTTDAVVEFYDNRVEITNLNYADDIYLDPTISLDYSSFDVADTYIESDTPNTNYGTGETMSLGWSSTSGTAMSYMTINLSQNLSQYILNPELITEAFLEVYKYEVSSTSPATYNTSYCRGSFQNNETTITWNNRNSFITNCVVINANVDWASGMGTFYSVNITDVILKESNGSVDTDRTFVIRWGDLRTYASTRRGKIATKEATSTSITPRLNLTFPQSMAILQINIYDETTNRIINWTNTTISLTGTNSTYKFITPTGNLTLIGLFSDNYDIYISASGYNYRVYNLNVTDYTTLNAYLLNTSLSTAQATTFTTTNNLNRPIENAIINISTYINDAWKTISNSRTDIMGKISIYLDTTTKYRFAVQKSGYQNKTFELYPSTNSYTIILKEISAAFNNTQGDITYSISPIGSVLMANDSQSFNLITNSPSGYIINYGVYYNSTIFDNNTDTTGGLASISLNTSQFDNSTIQIKYFIQSQGGLIEINRSYYIYSAEYETNQSLTGIFKNLTPQISPFYRFIIAIFVSLIIGAGFFSLIGAAASSFLALGIFIFFGIIGFIPVWLPIIAGIIIVLGYIVIGGNEGT